MLIIFKQIMKKRKQRFFVIEWIKIHSKKDYPQMNKSSRELVLEVNSRALEAVKEFLNNKNINKMYINSENPIISKNLVSYASEYYSGEFLRIDCRRANDIVDVFRKSIRLSFKYMREYYQGEMVDLKIIKNDANIAVDIEMTLKTNKMSKTIKIEPSLLGALSYINIGDVVYIEPGLGIIKRLGRSENKIDEYDLEGDKYVQLSKGQVYSVEEKIKTISLFDIDFAFNKYNETVSIFTRMNVDNTIRDYLKSDTVKFIETCISLENCHYLHSKDLALLFYLSKQFPFVKILFSGKYLQNNSFFDSVFFININNSERLINLMKYQCSKLDSEDFYKRIDSILNQNNYELILSILDTTDSLEEFLNVFYSQQIWNKFYFIN